MRILFVNKLYPPDIGGGAELVLRNLARGMTERGHDVLVVTTSSADHAVTETLDGVNVIRKPLRNVYWHHSTERRGAAMRFLWHLRDADNPAMGRSLGEAIDAFAPDVIQFHNLSGWSAAVWKEAFVRRIPTVQVLHDYYHACPKSQLFRDGRNCEGQCAGCGVLRTGRDALSQRVSALIGVSRSVIDAHLERGLFERVPLRRVIHNAWVPQEPLLRRTDRTPLTFGFIGSLAHWKGVRLLLDTFTRVAAEPGAPPLRLVVAGQGEAAYEADLRARFASERIEFLGRVSPEIFFRQIDVCVVPSLWHDPLPSVVFESLLFGVAVIGARRGGIPEMVSEGFDGFLFDPDAPDALASCLRRFASEPGLAARLGTRALVSSAPYADLGRVIDEHIDVCTQAIEHSGSVAAVS